MTIHRLDWRKIETALANVARAYGYACDQRSDSGDIYAIDAVLIPDSDTIDDLNLTELAKDLAKELAP